MEGDYLQLEHKDHHGFYNDLMNQHNKQKHEQKLTIKFKVSCSLTTVG